MKKLNARQKRFVAEYLTDLDPSAAARRSGYARRNPQNARIVAWRLLRQPEIAEAIGEQEQAVFEALRINAIRVTMQTARIAFLNPRDLLNSDGTLKPLEEIDDHALFDIAAIETVENRSGRRHKVRLRDTVRALELLTHQLDLMAASDAAWVNNGAGLEEDFERFEREEKELAEFRRQAAAKRLEEPRDSRPCTETAPTKGVGIKPE